MSFFHTTPLGRIINRLTKDTVDADKNLADFAAFFLRSMLQLISTIVLIGIVTPLALPALLPIMLLFYFLYSYFQVNVWCSTTHLYSVRASSATQYSDTLLLPKAAQQCAKPAQLWSPIKPSALQAGLPGGMIHSVHACPVVHSSACIRARKGQDPDVPCSPCRHL